MQWTFNPFEKIADIINVVTGPQAAQITSCHAKGAGRALSLPAHQTPANHVVHNFPKGSAGSPRFRTQFRSDIVVKCQCGTHVLMIDIRHHDVNYRAPNCV